MRTDTALNEIEVGHVAVLEREQRRACGNVLKLPTAGAGARGMSPVSDANIDFPPRAFMELLSPYAR